MTKINFVSLKDLEVQLNIWWESPAPAVFVTIGWLSLHEEEKGH